MVHIQHTGQQHATCTHVKEVEGDIRRATLPPGGATMTPEEVHLPQGQTQRWREGEGFGICSNVPGEGRGRGAGRERGDREEGRKGGRKAVKREGGREEEEEGGVKDSFAT